MFQELIGCLVAAIERRNKRVLIQRIMHGFRMNARATAGHGFMFNETSTLIPGSLYCDDDAGSTAKTTGPAFESQNGECFMSEPLDAAALDQIFRKARTYRRSADAWLPKTVTDEQLRAVYDLAKLGPTSGNCSPARIVFVRSPQAKEKLKLALDRYNVDQTMAAPATAIIGNDHAFYEQMPRLYKESPNAIGWFEGKPRVIAENAFRNATLQGAYLIIAARALGLDCGPMSGFDNAKLDELFFTGTQIRSNFLINIGYGNPEIIRPREYRFAFDEACRIE